MRAYFQRIEKCHYNKSNWLSRLTQFVKFRPSMSWGSGRHGSNGWLETSMSDLRLLNEEKKFFKIVAAAAIASLKAGIDSIAELATGPLPELDPNHWETMRRSQEGITRIPCAITKNGTRSSPKRAIRTSRDRQRRIPSFVNRMPGHKTCFQIG